MLHLDLAKHLKHHKGVADHFKPRPLVFWLVFVFGTNDRELVNVVGLWLPL